MDWVCLRLFSLLGVPLFETLYLAAALLLLCVVVALVAAVGLVWSVVTRRWVGALAFGLPLLVASPGLVFIGGVARIYRVPDWSGPVELGERYAGGGQGLELQQDGRYAWDAGESGTWSFEPTTGPDLTPHAGTLTLTSQAGELRELGARWDDAIGDRGQLLRLQ